MSNLAPRRRRRANRNDRGRRGVWLAWQVLGGFLGMVAGLFVAPLLNELFALAPGSLSWLGWLIAPPVGIVVGALLLPAWIENRNS